MASIYQRNGVWQIQYLKDGRKCRASLGTKNKKDALAAKRQIEAKLRDRERQPKSECHTIDEIWTLFEKWAKSRCSPATIDFHDWGRRLWIKHGLVQRAAEITQAHITLFVDSLRETGLKDESPGLKSTSINNALRAISRPIQVARKQGWYNGLNPFLLADREPVTITRKPFLSRAERQAAMAKAAVYNRDAELVCALGFYAGLRKKEIDAAAWTWINLPGRTLTVTHSKHFTTKDGAERVVPIHAALLALLESLPHRTGYLLRPDKDYGVNRYRVEFKKWFEVIKKALAADGVHLRAFTPHTMRHTFATLLAEAGVSELKIKSWLGHSLGVTSLYTHLNHYDEDIEKL